MFKKAKNVFAAFLTLALICFTAATSVTANAAANTSWNFKNSSFKGLGKITATQTIDGLGLVATSSKSMQVKAENVNVNGTAYTYCLALGGTGSTSYRAVKVPVSGSDTIKVVLRSSGSSTRSLIVADSKGKKLGTISAEKNASLGTYTYSGSAGYIYLYSANSGINIYKIQVDSNGSSSNSGNSGSNSGNNSSGSSSNSSGSDVTGDITVKNGGTSLADAVKKAKSGQTIVIDGTIKSGAVSLPAGVNIVGKNNATIDFSQTSGSSGRGITISGNGSTLENITNQGF